MFSLNYCFLTNPMLFFLGSRFQFQMVFSVVGKKFDVSPGATKNFKEDPSDSTNAGSTRKPKHDTESARTFSLFSLKTVESNEEKFDAITSLFV